MDNREIQDLLYDKEIYDSIKVSEKEVERQLPEYIKENLVSKVEIDEKFRKMIMDNLNETYCLNEVHGISRYKRLRSLLRN